MLHKYKVIFAISAGSLLVALLAHAQSHDPAWLEDVTIQLALEKQCNVGYFISMKESELAGQLFFEARAQCVDGRQFDAVRKGNLEPFKITKCKEMAVC